MKIDVDVEIRIRIHFRTVFVGIINLLLAFEVPVIDSSEPRKSPSMGQH